MSIKIYGKDSIIEFDGSNHTFNVQGKCVDGYLPTQSIPKSRIFKDSISMAAQILGSTFKNSIDVLTRRRKMAHELLFRSFINQILNGERMPYTVEEAYTSTRTFLEIIYQLD